MEDYSSSNMNKNKSNTSQVTNSSNTLDHKMDSSNEDIDPNVLQETGEHTIGAEWSVTSSALNSLDTNKSNSSINIEILKECCANPSDTLNDKEDFIIVESNSTGINISNFDANDTKYVSICKPTKFQKKHKLSDNNSHVFENILDSESQVDITQNSICLNRFQKRVKLITSNDEDFEINKSDNSGMNSVDVSMQSPKFGVSKNKKNQSSFNIPDYNLSTTNDASIIGIANISNVTENVFIKPSNFSLSKNEDSNNIKDVSKTEELTCTITQNLNDVVDNINNESCIISDIVLGVKNTSLNNISSVSNVSKSSSHNTVDMPSLNLTYDVSLKGNSTKKGFLSQSVQNNSELNNFSVEQPINQTYTLENDRTINKSNYNVSVHRVTAQNTLSDTYTVGNNFNETFTLPNLDSTFSNKIVNTLTDMSNIYSQSKSSVHKPNFFIRKLHLDEIPQDFNITVNDDDNSAVNDEINTTGNNKSKRFKLKKTCLDTDSKIFDNIINSTQENEISTSENTNMSNKLISNTLNATPENSNDYSLNKSKSMQNMEDSIDNSLTQSSNVFQDKVVENDQNLLKTPLLLKYNKLNSPSRPSGKFNFSKRFGYHSLSYHEKNTNFELVKQHSVSLNNIINKAHIEKSNIFDKSVNSLNKHLGSNLQTFEIHENQRNDQTLQHSDSFSPTLNISNPEGGTINYKLTENTSSFKLPQSTGPHFANKHNLNAHSGVFSDILADSLSSDTSLNASKQIKFKNHKHMSEAHSIMFENLITISQESNTSLSQNNAQNYSALFDQSNNQGDELSMFANTDVLLSNSESMRISDNSLENVLKHATHDSNSKVESLKENAVKESNISSDNSTSYLTKSKISAGNGTLSDQNYSLRSDNSESNHSISNITAGLLTYDSPSNTRQTRSASKSFLALDTNTSNLPNKTLDCDNHSFVSDNTGLSVTPNNEELTLSNSTSRSLHSKGSQWNQSKRSFSSRNTTSSLNNENLTNVSINDDSLESNETSKGESRKSFSSINSTSSASNDDGLTLFNVTTGSLDLDRSSKSQSKRSFSSRNLTSFTSNNEGKTPFNLTTGSLESDRLSRNKSKRSFPSRNLTNSAIFDEGLTLCNSHISLESDSFRNHSRNTNSRSLNQKKLPANQPKRSSSKCTVNSSKCSINTTNKSHIVGDNTKNISRMSTRSLKQKSFSYENEEQVSNNTKFTENEELLLNNTVKSLVQKKLSINQSERLTSKHSPNMSRYLPSTSNNSIMVEDNTNNVNEVPTRTLEQQDHSFNSVRSNNTEELLKNEELLLNTTAKSLAQKELPINRSKKSTSKHTPNSSDDAVNTTNKSSLLENSTKNVSRMSTRSLEHKSYAFENEELVSNNTEELPENEELLFNTTAKSLAPKELSINRSKKLTSKHMPNSSDDAVNTTNKSSLLENSTKNVSRMSTRSLKHKSYSFENEELVSNNTEELPENEELLFNTTAKSLAPKELSINRSKKLTSKHMPNSSDDAVNTTNKSSLLENSTKNVSRMSTRSLKHKSYSFENEELVSNNTEELPENEELLFNTTAKSLAPKELSINRSKKLTSKHMPNSSDDAVNTTNKSSLLENSTKNVSRMSTRSLKHKSYSFENEELVSNNTEELPENEELLFNTTAKSLAPKELSINRSKISTSKHTPNSSDNAVNTTNQSSLLENSTKNVSRMSTRSLKHKSYSFENEELVSNNTEELPENEELLFNTTAKSLAPKELSINRSKISTSKHTPNSSDNAVNTTNQSSLLEKSTKNVSRMSTCSLKHKSFSFENEELVLNNTEELPENEELLFNTTAKSLAPKELSINRTKKSTSKHTPNNSDDAVNTRNKSSLLENSTNNISRMSTRSLKHKSYSFENEELVSNNTEELPENEELLLNNTAKSLVQKELSINQYKISTSNISRDFPGTSNSLLMVEDDRNNVRETYTRSLEQHDPYFDSVGSVISNNTEKLPTNEELLLNTTAKSLVQMEVSISQPKRSTSKHTPNTSRKLSSDPFIIDGTNKVRGISTHSLEQPDHSFDSVGPRISTLTESIQEEKKQSSTRVTRSSASGKINKSLTKEKLKNIKSLISSTHVNYTSTRSSRTSNSTAISTNVSVSNDNDSTFWTTLSDNSTSISTNQNTVNEFQTPRNNKLTVTDHIINTIGIMSVNKNMASHPCVFELEDNSEGPLTRSLIKRSANNSPSILTKVFAGNNNFQSIILSQSFSDSIIDQSRVEENVKEKFKSLYNKEPWITKRLYNFLVGKLQPKYNIYSVKYAEKFVKYLASMLRQVYNDTVDLQLYTDMLRYHMARYGIIEDTFDYLGFLTDFIPRPYYDKLIPGWNLETSVVKFDPSKYYIPIVKDEEFLNQVLEYLNV